jgi:hypothetical protein
MSCNSEGCAAEMMREARVPAFIFYSCPRCRTRIETQDAYYSIGQPFVVCKKCDGHLIIAENRTEWELLSPTQHFLHHARVVFFALWLGAGTGGLLAMLASELFQLSLTWWILSPAGIAIWYWIMSADLRRNIAESRTRMADKKYRKILEYLEIIPKAE